MTSNETDHYKQGDVWLERAEQAAEMFADDTAKTARAEDVAAVAAIASTFAAIAQAHYAGSQAADIDREADAEARIAECVPEGGSRLQVAVPR